MPVYSTSCHVFCRMQKFRRYTGLSIDVSIRFSCSADMHDSLGIFLGSLLLCLRSLSLMHIKCPICKPGMTEAGSDVVIEQWDRLKVTNKFICTGKYQKRKGWLQAKRNK